MLLLIAAIGLVAVIALVLACVAITTFPQNKSASDNKNDENTKRLNDEAKRLNEYQHRLQVVEEQLNINGDVKKPEVSEILPADAFQISVYTDAKGTDYSTQRAIDGNDHTFMLTNRHTNPWWCADMQDIYHIKRVVVTNRQTSATSTLARATNLRVGVTNIRPQIGQTLALDAYELCAEEPGYMGALGIVTCPHGISGQYLVVQFQVENQQMNIAEVKIYGYKDKL